MTKSRRAGLIRRVVQLSFAVFILVSSVRHSVSIEHLPSTDAYCPFGAVETLWTFVRTGTFVQKTHPSNLVLGVGLLLGAVLAGASFCGWICPFGALNDLLTWIRRKLRLPEIRVPARVDRILTYGRFVTLIAIPVITVLTAKLWFSSYDPYRTIFSLSWVFEFNLAEQWPAYAVALGVIAGGTFIPRFWCRYLCPQGALLGLIQRISPIAIGRNKATCIDCKLCDRACPSRLSVSTAKTVRGDCIGCLECVEVCPRPETLAVNLGRPRRGARAGSAGGRAMRIAKYAMPLVAIVALLGTVMASKALGYWQTSGRDMVDPNAPMTGADIRGWMSLEYVSDGFGIPLEELRALLGVPPSTPAGTPLKDLELVIEVSEVRTRIEETLGGLPPAPEGQPEAEPTAPPAEPTPTATLAAPVPDHQPGTGQGAGEGTGEGLTPLPPGQVLPPAQIKGRMTLREVSEQCDVPLEGLIDELGIPTDAPADVALRDLVAQIEGFEVSQVRDVVATLQAR